MAQVDPLFDPRDTDADWRALGLSQPYWGVLSHPDFRTENITPERVEAFFASGRAYIEEVIGHLAGLTGRGPSGPALDFGCGVGRLAEAMAEHAPTTGFDISPGMLDLARRGGGKAAYSDQLPDGPFGWINSFIVFQHIPPERGLEILRDLLARLAPGGAISLQITVWRSDRHVWTAPPGWRGLLERRRRRAWARKLPVGQILMYDYDLSAVVRLLTLAGVDEMKLVSTDHDGHRGVIILGRRNGAAEPLTQA